MSVYKRVSCSGGGICNEKGAKRKCTKCGQRVKGTWWYRFRFGGRIIHESAKTPSKTLAKDAERHRRRELEEKWNHVKKRELPPTVNAAASLWLEKRAALEDSTRETYKAALEHVKTAFGKRLVCDINAQDIRTYQKTRQREGAAGATVNKEVTCLSSILSDYGLWAPLRRDVKRLEENEDAGTALNADQEKKLLQQASRVGLKQGNWSPIYQVTVLGLNTGLRHAEIRKLHWKDVDLEKRVLVVGKTKTEAGKGRAIPLMQPAWAVLEMWAFRFPNRKPEEYIFPACENAKIDPNQPVDNWRTAWRRACESSGLAGLRFHDLRHTAATKMLEGGIPFASVAQVLGWSPSTTVRMVKRYGHIRPEAQRRALEAIATPEIHQWGVHQIGNQDGAVIKSSLTN